MKDESIQDKMQPIVNKLEDALKNRYEDLLKENQSLKSENLKIREESIPKSAIYKIMGNLRSIMDGQEFANIKFCIENEIENYKEETK